MVRDETRAVTVRDFSGHLLVLGLGASGEAAAEWALGLLESGAAVEVTVVDSMEGEVLEARAARLRSRGAQVLLGTDELPTADIIVASPGIPPTSAIMRAARGSGAPVISEIELAYRVSSAPWVAITGTNGKTTTTALVTHLLREAGFAAEPAGNFGPPAVRVACEVGPAGVIVAEVSSFQLSLVEGFHPAVAVMLNVTPDHLDYHGSMAAYAADKARIFANQAPGDVAVIDVDDPGSSAMVPAAASRGTQVLTVSRTAPQDRGAYVRDGVIVFDDGSGPLDVLPLDDLAIKGVHNVSNALAAIAAAASMGADAGSLGRGLRRFRPLEHRLEPVGVFGGVEYFNDSKATNPDAVIKALTAFEDQPVVLLLGGRNKGVDLRPLAAAVAVRCKAVVLFGEAAPELEAAFSGLDVIRTSVPTLADGVKTASLIVAPGDVVLLSPGCTSFDAFADYTERGRRFKEMVALTAGGERE